MKNNVEDVMVSAVSTNTLNLDFIPLAFCKVAIRHIYSGVAILSLAKSPWKRSVSKDFLFCGLL